MKSVSFILILLESLSFMAVSRHDSDDLSGGEYFNFHIQSPAGICKDVEPTAITLKDSSSSTILQCTKQGNTWEISSGNPGSYLSYVANDLGKNGLNNFHDFKLDFAFDYSAGSLTGTATDQNGNNVPIGVVYAFRTRVDDTVTMFSGEEHTCTGTPCSCCDFVRKDGVIIGCRCLGEYECHVEATSKCDHTVKTTQQ